MCDGREIEGEKERMKLGLYLAFQRILLSLSFVIPWPSTLGGKRVVFDFSFIAYLVVLPKFSSIH